MKTYLFLCLLLMINYTRAQSVNAQNEGNAINAALQASVAIINAVTSDNSIKNTVPSDTISGSCEFMNGTCNGAVVTIVYKDETIYSTIITSNSEFHVAKLKPNESYKVLLEWKAKKLDVTRNVRPGEFVQIKLKQ